MGFWKIIDGIDGWDLHLVTSIHHNSVQFHWLSIWYVVDVTFLCVVCSIRESLGLEVRSESSVTLKRKKPKPIQFLGLCCLSLPAKTQPD